MKKYKAVLFDMDGVLVDSEELYCSSEIEAARRLGLELDREGFCNTLGKSEQWIEGYYSRIFGGKEHYLAVRSLADKLFEEHVAEHGVNLKPGVMKTLNWLENKGIPICLVTSNAMEDVNISLGYNKLIDLFDEIVTGEMCERSKPAPDIYLLGAKRLGFAPEECIAIEDSPAGVESASAASCYTVLIPDMLDPTDQMIKLANTRLDSMESLPELFENLL